MSLLVVGSVAFDCLESPYGKVERALGGAATYFAVAASHFTHVNLVAIVGDDFTSKRRRSFSRPNYRYRRIGARRRQNLFLVRAAIRKT